MEREMSSQILARAEVDARTRNGPGITSGKLVVVQEIFGLDDRQRRLFDIDIRLI
jgi:hypothetical protein